VLVTGASRGIGRAVALACAESGADVAGLARTESALDELGAEVRDAGASFLAVPTDLHDLGAVASAVDRAWAWKPLDALINAAGIMVRSQSLEITPEQWDEVFAVNVRASFFLCQAVGRKMLEGRGGSITNIASVAAEVATGASVVYSASKGAIVQMSRVLAVRWAPKIRVNAVGPAYIRTDLNSEWLDEPDNAKFVTDRTPLGRVGSVSDVVGPTLFLTSDGAAYVTGQHLLVDGGWAAQ
jgi:NAD(P)-dependent dehydrogenase (short-subunit alcohol dehydrogenase family)